MVLKDKLALLLSSRYLAIMADEGSFVKGKFHYGGLMSRFNKLSFTPVCASHVAALLAIFALAVCTVWGAAATSATTELFLRGYSVVPSPRDVRLEGGHLRIASEWLYRTSLDSTHPALCTLRDDLAAAHADRHPSAWCRTRAVDERCVDQVEVLRRVSESERAVELADRRAAYLRRLPEGTN
jgi:hypothetical protein